MSKKIIVHICNKDRPSELALLLQSLRTQTYKNFNIVILDDGSKTPLTNYYFIMYMINRLKYEGHGVKIIRNNKPSGVSKARQQLIDWSLENGDEDLFARVDDDVILNKDYLEKLVKVIDEGYDVASGVTTPFINPDMERDIKYVKPIIGYCELDNEGNIVYMGDECGFGYNKEEIIPAPHFRSCALFKREVFESGVSYDNRLSKNGFLEEAILSFKAILKGFKIGVNTKADARHLMAPSGGMRDTMNLIQFNMEMFKETVKKMFEENGDFLDEYYKKLGIDISEINVDYNYQHNLMREK